MQIHKRPMIVLQLIGLCLLSPYYVHLSLALVEGVSSLSLKAAQEFVESYYPILLLTFMAIISVWRMARLSLFLTGALILTSISLSMKVGLFDMNKVVLVLSFVYLITAYYLIMMMKLELHSAGLNPLYSSHTIGPKTEYDLNVRGEIGEKAFSGKLTNWDENSCFIVLSGPFETRNLGGMTLELEFKIDQVKFSGKGVVVSSYKDGIGVRFLPLVEGQGSSYNWIEFYKIIDDRGYFPRSKAVG